MLNEHRMIDTAERLLNPLGWNSTAQSRSYLINITGVVDVPNPFEDMSTNHLTQDYYRKKQQMRLKGAEEYYVEYHCTLYSIGERQNASKKEHAARPGFYGRTYKSSPKLLKRGIKYHDSNEEDFIFLHTSFSEPTTRLIIEVVVTKN